MKHQTVFKLGELFSGPGGFGLGTSRATVTTETHNLRIEHGWAIDKDKDACETFRHNLCPQTPERVICRDVKNIDFTTLSPVDAIAFGFPCNDFSIVGEHRGLAGDYGPLYSYGVKAITHFRPQWFVAENVGGLQSANEGRALQEILAALRGAGDGYQLSTHLYRFEEYGVPQTRHRIIIVGTRADLNLPFAVPAPTHTTGYVSAQRAIESPLIPATALNHERTKQSKTVIARLEHTRPGENAWNADLPPHLRLNVKGAKLSQIYRRLEADKPAYTVTGSGGGGTHVYHWAEPRALTNRERARLQTFPDEFIFHGSKESVRRQIGMAIPPLGAQVIVEAILQTFAGVAIESVEPKWSEQKGKSLAAQLRLFEEATPYAIMP